MLLSEQPQQATATGWTPVDVVGSQVQYNAERKLWFADIQIDPGESYCPFIRLARARYQPNSVLGVELSSVVLCDFMQLLPDRTLTASLSADGATLNLELLGVSQVLTGEKEVVRK